MSATEVKTKTEAEKARVVKGGSFVQENQKSLLFIAAAIVVMIVIYVAYLKLYLAPREGKAANQMHVAQDFWANKEWDKAINGDAGYPGFKKIIADYSNTKTANLAYFYLGTAYLNKGEYRQAIENLSNFHGDDNMVSAEALGATGDAYVELKDYDKAETYFKKAADKASNKFLSPLYLKKLGLVYEAKKDKAAAAEAYKKIKSDYPESAEAQSIDAYIGRVEAK
ncbi:tetratricopeptide repeat protein [Mucilaginibacter achroorhodeus]|uniref:Tetratricopeptide repeat protein n=1 Tax=Mucilaginibacter achroorhodeus TaxID=2599294 RepID=A0A563UA39_9SPHI|nr:MULTISPECIES: tetratricopeptide repeat protein [Mucilaginibacter]QXV66674.1 tetratricopeptide repeat protein [Mucilaginibacter sp. 21P]TWR28215.1 tetratricopeptide repeat protein [Mucilaginibacter achroorhodeus]